MSLEDDSQSPRADADTGAKNVAGGSLRRFLLKLRESPAAQDRFIFDPIGIMEAAGLTAEEQDVLLSGDPDAINALVWPKGHAPRNGPIMTIDLVNSAWGQMPVVRKVHDYHIVTTPGGPETPNSASQVVGGPCGFMGSVATPTAQTGPQPMPGQRHASAPGPIQHSRPRRWR
jgi:hypothetical protein